MSLQEKEWYIEVPWGRISSKLTMLSYILVLKVVIVSKNLS